MLTLYLYKNISVRIVKDIFDYETGADKKEVGFILYKNI